LPAPGLPAHRVGRTWALRLGWWGGGGFAGFFGLNWFGGFDGGCGCWSWSGWSFLRFG
jgi:hypothetical protein